MNPPLEARRPFALPSDFYRLGLKRGECSSMAIRDATQSAVHRLADAASRQSLDLIDRQLGLLATSAYRLLDPRYRLQLYERIQLSYAIDRDDVVSPIPRRNALLTVPDASIAVEGLLEPPKPRSDDSSSDRSLEGAREVVRWIRHSDASHRPLRRKWAGKILLSLKNWMEHRTG